jgi:CheY-like chemotaxis protein
MTTQLRTMTQARPANVSDSVAGPVTPDQQPGDNDTAKDTLRVLHVEDNPADALLMQEHLHGVVPDLIFDTATRLAELTPERAASADCALLDLSLPDATGLDAVIALRKMSDNIPIIVLTGFDNLELGLSAVRDGADDYLLKSHVDGYSLERAIQYAIERRRLLLEIASSNFTAKVATAAARSAIAQHNEPPEALNAVGTHEVSVRIDSTTGDYALQCSTCAWEADRGPDDLHSWSDRSLDVVLLHHLDYSRLRQSAAAKKQATEPAIGRRGIFRPRRWLTVAPDTTPDV